MSSPTDEKQRQQALQLFSRMRIKDKELAKEVTQKIPDGLMLVFHKERIRDSLETIIGRSLMGENGENKRARQVLQSICKWFDQPETFGEVKITVNKDGLERAMALATNETSEAMERSGTLIAIVNSWLDRPETLGEVKIKPTRGMIRGETPRLETASIKREINGEVENTTGSENDNGNDDGQSTKRVRIEEKR